MTLEEFVMMLIGFVRDEFVAISEVSENVISVRFTDGKKIKIFVTEG